MFFVIQGIHSNSTPIVDISNILKEDRVIDVKEIKNRVSLIPFHQIHQKTKINSNKFYVLDINYGYIDERMEKN